MSIFWSGNTWWKMKKRSIWKIQGNTPSPENGGTSSFGSRAKGGETTCMLRPVPMYDCGCVVTMIIGDGKRGGAELSKRSETGLGCSNRVSFNMRSIITDYWAASDFYIVLKSSACWFTEDRAKRFNLVHHGALALVNRRQLFLYCSRSCSDFVRHKLEKSLNKSTSRCNPKDNWQRTLIGSEKKRRSQEEGVKEIVRVGDRNKRKEMKIILAIPSFIHFLTFKV